MSAGRAAFNSAIATGAKLAGALISIKIIAIYLGPEGLGLIGHFMSLIAILVVLSVAGTSLGITRFIAEKSENRLATQKLLRTASAIMLVACTLIAIIMFVGAKPFSRLLFKTESFAFTLQISCLLLIPLGFSNLGLAVINGLSDTKALACIQLGAALIGSLGTVILVSFFDATGAALGLLWMAACPSIFIALWWIRHQQLRFSNLYPIFEKDDAIRLMQYAGMMLFTVVFQNLTQIWIRNNLESAHGWETAGYWQAMTRLSDAYLQVFNVYLVAYLLPRLTQQKDKAQVMDTIFSTYRFVLPLLVTVLIIGYFFRHFVIKLALSNNFSPVEQLFAPQMIGDLFKLIAFIPAYLIIARGYLPLYIVADPVQAMLLITFNAFLVPSYGALGACWAYSISYALYAMLSIAILCIYFFWTRLPVRPRD
jgi:O-antigen/teichoic acid export membrane protein